MAKRTLSIILAVAMLITTFPALVFATDDISGYVSTTLPTSWQKTDADFKITGKNIKSMSVNGTPVTETPADDGGISIKSDGKPYMVFKKHNYDEATNVLAMALYVGNVKSGTGQFAVKFDPAKWELCRANGGAITNTSTSLNRAIIPFDDTKCEIFGIDEDYALSMIDSGIWKNITGHFKTPTDSAKGATSWDKTNGVLYTSWYSPDGLINSTTAEAPILMIYFKYIGEGTPVFDAQTFVNPLLSELDRPATPNTSILFSEGDLEYTPEEGTLLYAQNFDGRICVNGTELSNESTFNYTGNTEGLTSVKVDIVTKDDVSLSHTYKVLVDKTNPTLNVSQPDEGTEYLTYTFAIEALDNESGLKSLTVNNTDITGSTTYEVSTSGTYTFVATDKAGNVTTVTREFKVAEAPTLTVTPAKPDWSATDVVLTVEVSEGATVTVDGTPLTGKTFTATESKTYHFVATNSVGLTAEADVEVKIDKTNPTLNVSKPDEGTEYLTYTFSIEALDNESDLKSLTVNNTDITGRKTYEVSTSGTYTFVATDNVGNKTTVTREFKVADAPQLEVTPSATDWTKENVEITINKLSANATLTVNDEPFTGSVYVATTTGTYKFVATNTVGLKTEKTVEVKIDKNAPVLDVSPAPTKACKEHTFTVSANDGENESGLVSVKVNGVDITGKTSYKVTETDKYIFVATDKAGNVTTVERSVTIDNEAPVVEITGVPSGWATSDVVLTISVTGGAETVTLNGNPFTGTSYTVTDQGETTVTVVAVDEAGNEGSKAVTVKIDKTKPSVEILTDLTDWVASGTTVSFKVTDQTSGVLKATVDGVDVALNQDGTGEFEITENKKYVIKAYDNAQNEYTYECVIDKIDTEAPEVSVGAENTEWAKSVVVTITASDAKIGIDKILVNDVDKTSEFTVSNGTYTLVYTATENGEIKAEVTDKAGNTNSDAVTLTKIDSVKPVISSIAEPTELCPEYTFEFTVSDALSGVAEVKCDGEIINAEGGVYKKTVDQNGEYVFTAKDYAGNVAEVRANTNGMIDNVKPEVIVNYNTAFTNGNVVIAISSDKAIAEIKVNGTVISGTDYTVTENDTYNIEITDLAGNKGTKSVTIDNIDRTKPTLSVDGVPSDYVKSFTLTITPSDDKSGIFKTEMNGKEVGATVEITENNTYTFVAYDNAGNASDKCVVNVNCIDKEFDSFTVTPVTTGFAKEYVVTIEKYDSKSGVKSVVINETTVVTDRDSYTFTENGTYTFVATDNLGNIKQQTVVIDKIDNDAPILTVTDAPLGWTNSFSFGITADDNEGSGVDKIYVNGIEFSGTTYPVTENGTYTFKATDKLGNESAEITRIVDKVDTVKPSISITPDPTEWTLSHEITVTVSDDESGVKEVTVNGSVIDVTQPFVVTANDEYKFKVTDNAGNTAEVTANIQKIDADVPVFTGEIVATSVGIDSISVTMPTATDVSDLTYKVYLNGTEVADFAGVFEGLTKNTEYEIKITATDKVGNTSSKTLTVKTLDLGKVLVTLDLAEIISGTPSDVHFDVILGDKTAKVSADGKAEFTDVTAGTYEVKIKADGYFEIAKGEVVVENNKTTLVAVAKEEFVAGDSTNDGVIDIYDLNAVASLQKDSYDDLAYLKFDFNRDGKVDVSDIQMLVKNLGKTK